MSKVKSNYEIISDKTKNAVVNTEYIQHGTGWLDTVINQATSAVNSKADKTYVDTELAKKANSSDVSALQTTVQSKADSSTVTALSGRVTDAETEQDVLSARMDTFTTLEEGSTTGDAELADAHVGVNGKTYTNVGDAIRGQITDLKGELTQLGFDYDIVENKFIRYSTGELSNSDGYVCTDYIPVTWETGTVSVLTYVQNDISGIAFYDANKKYISGYNQYSESGALTEIDIPKYTFYIRVSCLKTKKDDFIIKRSDVLTSTSAIATENNEVISTMSAELGNLSFTIIENAFIRRVDGGLVTNNTGYIATDYIYCYDINIAVETYNDDDTTGICFYDEKHNYISGYNSHSDNGKLTKLEIPNGAFYVRVCCLKKKRQFFKIVMIGVVEKVKDNTIDINNIQDGKVSDISSDIIYTSGRYVRYDGKIKELEVYSTSDLIHVKKGDKIKVTGVGNSPGVVAMLSKWTSAGAYISTIYVTTKTTEETVVYTVVDTDEYLKICYNSAGDNKIPRVAINTLWNNNLSNVVFDTMKKTYENSADISKIGVGNFWSYSMWKVLCIGDSLTSGASYGEEWGAQTWTGASIDENYPRMFGRMINGEVTNAGFSGYSASDWWTNKRSNYNFANYDTFIIWLGTNQGLTDTLDTDVTPYTDYNDFAETETGFYCKIISKIKAENPSCLIVLTKIYASKGDVSTTNTVIEKIASKYSLPVIDNSDLGVSLHPELHAGVNNVHFGKAGNAFIANRYVNKIGEWFNANPLRCEYHYTSRTN